MLLNNKGPQNATNSVAANAAPASAGIYRLMAIVRSSMGGTHVFRHVFSDRISMELYKLTLEHTCKGDEVSFSLLARTSYCKRV